MLFNILLVSIFTISANAADFSKVTPELLTKGEASYKTNCLICHGEKGEGNGPAGNALNPKPRNFLKDKFKTGDKPAQIFASLTKGLPGTVMGAYSHLSEEERWALTHYVLKLKSGK